MLLDSQPYIWCISIDSHEAEAFRLGRPREPVGDTELPWDLQHTGMYKVRAS